jgi:hypothetical protein
MTCFDRVQPGCGDSVTATGMARSGDKYCRFGVEMGIIFVSLQLPAFI